MKSMFRYLFAICIIFIGCSLFSACKLNEEDEKTSINPILEKHTFSITYTVDDFGDYDYKLNWSTESATSYKVVYGDTVNVISDSYISINDFPSDVINTVKVIAINEDGTKSNPVEVKFRGTKLDEPYNFRVYGSPYRIGWNTLNDNKVFKLIFEEVESDNSNIPVGKGMFKSVVFDNNDTFTDNQISIEDLQKIYKNNNLKSQEKVTIQSLPYDGVSQTFNYSSSTEVIELIYPSEESEQSVILYVSDDISAKPNNLRWGVESINDDLLKLKWDNVTAGYKYKVRDVVYDNEEEYSGSLYPVGVGDNAYEISDLYFKNKGLHTVTVEAVCDTINHISDNVYSFCLSQESTEYLNYRINQTKLDEPQNVHLENETIVWDKVENAESYMVSIECGETSLGVQSTKLEVSLEDIYNKYFKETESSLHLDKYKDLIGNCKIWVKASSDKKTSLISLENSIPIFEVVQESEEIVEDKIKINPIKSIENVNVDYEKKTITWNENNQATGYEIAFCKENISVIDKIKDNQYVWDLDINEYEKIVIKSLCEYQVIEENGIITMLIPSLYVLDL